MSLNLVLTLTGTDRVGIVDEVTRLLLNLGGNVEASRMARLGGEFAMLMLVALPSDQAAPLELIGSELAAKGYKVTITPTGQTQAPARPGWLPYRIEVHGADHEGIIHEIAHTLSQSGISIETMDTGTTPAPNSGTPLFTMDALVVAPPGLAFQDWHGAVEDAAHRLHVDIQVSAVSKS